MDPLEDVLQHAGVRSHLSVGLEAGGDWAVRFDPPADFGIKFNTVTRGAARIEVAGEAPADLAPGDCFLLTRPRPFTLRGGAPTEETPAADIFRGVSVARAGAGADTRIIGGSFTFTPGAAADRLLAALPAVVHVPAGTGSAETLAWALRRIDAELREPLAGELVSEHLAMVMFVHVLRVHLARGGTTGWLAALDDATVAPALRAMHEHPEHAWTVGELAQRAAVSRSTMAARFTRVVGQAPLDYLTSWRIDLAADRLRTTDDTLAVIARATGYGSESALSTAFKRRTGTSPASYRRTGSRLSAGPRPSRAPGSTPGPRPR